MGKKNKQGLGRALIKDRFSKRGPRKNDSLLHTAELNDGADWGRLNLQSVTEESSFQEFLSTAQLAGTEFQAEKLNINFVSAKVAHGLLTKEQMKAFEKTKEEKKDLLRIPRRPKWDEETTTEDLQARERDSFLEWRRQLAMLQEQEGILMTPYEKNLDFWRQLWRVVERSDVVIQILDARDPLLFRCEDLEKYVKEVNPLKRNLLLINKSDFLTDKQRKTWHEYFSSQGIDAVFFSALKAAEELDKIKEEDEGVEENGTTESDDNQETEEDDSHDEGEVSDAETTYFSAAESENEINKVSDDLRDELRMEKKQRTPWSLLGREELIELFSNILGPDDHRMTSGVTTVGLVGYPNVGKSSSINALMAGKKVSVSATPGKTKHFQTLFLTPEVLLCDCPGLVFPSLVATKADMVLNGILPVDQLRDHVPSIGLLCQLIPRHVLEDRYSIMICIAEGQSRDQPPTPEEFLNALAYSRGYMTQNGQPDNPRAARGVLKEFVTGRLLYCKAPPGIVQEEYHEFQMRRQKPVPVPTVQAQRATRLNNVTSSDIDKVFFRTAPSKAHLQGVQKFGPIDTESVSGEKTGKPWKDHSAKRNKREKLRRVYRHLDLV
uniref:Large subunit GTPase 1 homolog n=3 Tax=Lygus hesperus TaxID=30085 RepID=A0A0A9WJ77_LYGHE